MTVIPTQAQLLEEENSIPLVRYAKIIGYSECSFFGVNHDVTPYACRSIWVKSERDMVQRYLAEAQREIEAELRFFLGVRWTTEHQPYRYPLLSQWGHVIQGGIRGTTAIQADAAVDHTTDPAIVGPIATTVTDEDEIKVFYPASLVEGEIEIHPSDIDLAGGNVTIYIPRCRIVAPDLVDNARAGLDYTVLANFLQVVDVTRVYNDPSTNASLIWPHQCTTPDPCACSCGEYTRDGCIYVASPEIGRLEVLPATYSGGSWARTSSSCSGTPHYAQLYYQAGEQLFGSGRWELAQKAEDAVVRLAHSKMPEEPCGCQYVRAVWQRDRNIPQVGTRERINCPFGLSDGAWAAWRFTQDMKLTRGGGL